jgi:hypothetical protein
MAYKISLFNMLKYLLAIGEISIDGYFVSYSHKKTK